MAGLNWSASRAGLLSLGVTAVIAVLVFLPADEGANPVPVVAGAMVEAGFTALTILWILLPALGIYELQRRLGTIDDIRQALTGLSRDHTAGILLVSWFFALFFEGAAGFGTPVALAAPLLVALGVPAERALAAALIGHAAGVSFGAVGTPILPQIVDSGLSGLDLSFYPALLHGLLGFILVAALLRVAEAPRTALAMGARAFVFFAVPFFLIAAFIGPELPTLAGALIGGALFVLAGPRDQRDAGPGPSFLRAASPYLVLVVLVAATRLVPPIKEALESVVLSWQWDQFSGVFAPLYHPGTMLAAAFVIGAVFQKARPGDAALAIGAAARRLVPVVVALVAMLGVARLLVHSGMIEELATALGDALGQGWPVAAPFVGALGTFVTGSATASNVLFTEMQLSIAEQLGLSVLVILGAQSFGAAVGNIICPHNIVAGCATVGIPGREGDIMRRTLPVALVYALAGGALTLLLTS